MDKINVEINEMYKDLMASSKDKSDEINIKSLNDVKNAFRQHINDRRNKDQKDLLMEEHQIERIKEVKELSYNILSKFKNLNTSSRLLKNHGSPEKFANLDEFNTYVNIQQEILSSELWKLDVISSFADEK